MQKTDSGAATPLEGQVALVSGAGEIGRAIALALAAQGVRVVVAGENEHASAGIVGEIAFGGGKARHVTGHPHDPAAARAAVGRAVEVFGSLDIVVACADETAPFALGADVEARGIDALRANVLGIYATFDAALTVMKGWGCLIATGHALTARAGADDGVASSVSRTAILSLVDAVAREVAERGIACAAVPPTGQAASEAEEVAVRVLALCGRPARQRRG